MKILIAGEAYLTKNNPLETTSFRVITSNKYAIQSIVVDNIFVPMNVIVNKRIIPVKKLNVALSREPIDSHMMPLLYDMREHRFF